MSRRHFVLIIAIVFAAAIASAEEPDATKHRFGLCPIEGSYYGWSGSSPWTTIFTATSWSGGTVIAQWTGSDGQWFGICEGSDRLSQGIGVWRRTGRRSFEFSMVNFSLDEDGQPVCIWKNSGWGEINPGCETGWMKASVEFFHGDQNPFEDEPFTAFPPGDTAEFFRMSVQPHFE